VGRICIAIGPGAAGRPSLAFEPAPLSIAALGRGSTARRTGKLLGLTASSLGIDLVFTPHVDSVFNPKNPSGVLDSFGEDSESASRLCAAFIEGIHAGGAEACALGFPCSAMREGSFSEVYPVAEVSMPKLCGAGSKPLASAIHAGLGAILVGRVLVPSMEPARLPAPSSANIVNGRLRGELGFKGLVIGESADRETDPVGAIISAAEAGCDLTIFMDPSNALAASIALDAFAGAGNASAGSDSASGFEHGAAVQLDSVRNMARRSAARLTSLLERLPGKVDLRKLEAVERSMLGSKVARERLESCVIVKDDCAFDGSGKPGFILAFTPGPANGSERNLASFMEIIGKAFPAAEILQSCSDPDADTASLLADRILQAAGRASESASATILCCNAHFRPEQEALARIVAEAFSRYSVIAMKDPYDLAFFPDAQGLAAVFGYSPAASAAIVTLLSGRHKSRSTMPVNLVGLDL
jgi:beta-N-acetylhexosaminidase